ncbi:MAG: methyltransferase domain-containing protein [Monoglobales bacterium]
MQKDNSLLYRLFSNIPDEDTCQKVFDIILSDDEQLVLSDRLNVALMFEEGKSNSDIAAATESSAITMSKIREALSGSGLNLAGIIASASTNPYSVFSEVYDSLTEDVEYEKRADYITSLLRKFGKDPEIILDLGCGTGSITSLLAKKGYSMIGVDISSEMLAVAADKAEKNGLDILYLNQPMEDFELYGSVGAAVSLLDSLNYVTEEKDLEKTFRLVHNYLDPGGLFIFDINTAHKLKNILPGNTFCGESDKAFYTWENVYDPEYSLCEFTLNFFIKNGKNFTRHTETHYQKAYTDSFIKKLLKRCGFEVLAVYDDLTFDSPARSSEKVFYVARKVKN